MSGICGIVRLDAKSVQKDEIQSMLDGMENRGKDAENIWIENSVGLGHKMLWTTPESLHEKQPLISEDANLVLVSDARIDNREALMEKLEVNENDYEVITDVDLILWSYQKWGEDCPKYLIGDFAFVIWDRSLKQLFCARDPIGIKQFYYYKNDNYLIFSSEIAPIFTYENIIKAPNLVAIKNFLTEMALPYQDTLYKNIYRLSPAHTISFSNTKMLISRYWFPENIEVDYNLSMDEAIKKFNELFTLSVNARLRSAYPIGIHVSGGLDSSSVATTACSLKEKDTITAFSVHYGALKCDESKYSNAVIDELDIHSEIIQGDMLDYENRYTIDSYNEVQTDWSGAGLFINEIPIMEKAKSLGIRVMLTGQGGDHILTGNHYRYADYVKNFKLIRLYKSLRYINCSPCAIKRYIILPLLSANSKKVIRFLLGKKKKAIKEIDHMAKQGSYFLDVEYRPKSFSQYEDLRFIAGMGNAMWMSSGSFNLGGRYDIEYRHPFFDRRLIEFTLMLPPEMKMNEDVIKVLLRNAMLDRLPEVVRSRNDKAEFSEILKKQFKYSKINKCDIMQIIKYGLIERKDIDDAFEAFENDTDKSPMFFWNTILIEKWLQFNFK